MALPPDDDRRPGNVAFRPGSHRPASSDGEWDILQEILRQAPSPIARDFLLHYYVSAKTWPLVLVIGRPGVGKRHLFHLLASGIAGCSTGQVHLLPTQPHWRQHTGQAQYFGSIQSRFNTMTFLDLLAEASSPGNEGQAYFLALDQSSPQELSEYMDLYLAQPGRLDGPPPLPSNLYVTAVLSTTGGTWQLPPALLDRVGIVEVAVPLGEGVPAPEICPPVGWQRLFLRSTVRDPERARRRLQGFELLAQFHHLLAPLRASLAAEMSAEMEEGLLLYAANSFTTTGAGLLEPSAGANLRQAIDLQLAQRLLPCLAQRPSWAEQRWDRLLAQLDGTFPLGHARARRILLQRSSTSLADLDAISGLSALPTPPALSSTERGNR